VGNQPVTEEQAPEFESLQDAFAVLIIIALTILFATIVIAIMLLRFKKETGHGSKKNPKLQSNFHFSLQITMLCSSQSTKLLYLALTFVKMTDTAQLDIKLMRTLQLASLAFIAYVFSMEARLWITLEERLKASAFEIGTVAFKKNMKAKTNIFYYLVISIGLLYLAVLIFTLT